MIYIIEVQLVELPLVVLLISNNYSHSNLPAIAASGSNVYAVWFDNTHAFI